MSDFRLLNERKTSNLQQNCLYLSKNKEIHMYWVLFVILLDLRQGLIVLKSMKIKLVQHHLAICGSWGVKIFVWGVLRGVMACGGWWHSVGGVTLEWGVTWQLCVKLNDHKATIHNRAGDLNRIDKNHQMIKKGLKKLPSDVEINERTANTTQDYFQFIDYQSNRRRRVSSDCRFCA